MATEGGAGGTGEFEASFDRDFARAVSVVSRMGLGSDDAEDVVLEAMAVTYDRWSKVRQLEYSDAWFFEVATNRALRARKRAGRTPPMAEPMAALDPDDLAWRMVLRDGIAALPLRQRQVVTLRYVADLSVEEVASSLEMSTGAVKQHASRGRAALRRSLGASDAGGATDATGAEVDRG